MLESRLLLSDIPRRLVLDDEGCPLAAVLDPGVLSEIVEELVASSATGVVIPSCNTACTELLDQLPEFLRTRVQVASSESADLRTYGLLGPLLEEHSIKLNGWSVAAFKGQPASTDLVSALLCLGDGIQKFLLGMQFKLQVQIRIPRMLKAISQIRNCSRNPEVTSKFAILEGVLRTYELANTTSIQWREPSNRSELLAHFNELLNDSEFKSLSQGMVDLGIPSMVSKTLSRARRSAIRLLRNQRFLSAFQIGANALGVGGSVASGMAAFLFSDSYLPVITNIEQRVRAGFDRRVRKSPDFDPRPYLPEGLRGCKVHLAPSE